VAGSRLLDGPTANVHRALRRFTTKCPDPCRMLIVVHAPSRMPATGIVSVPTETAGPGDASCSSSSSGLCVGCRPPDGLHSRRDQKLSGDAGQSGKVSKPHPVGSAGDHDLGVLTVADIALKITNAVPPAHLVPRAPNRAYEDLGRCGPPAAPMTCFERRARRQSCST
jgi:hypothetical protein